MAGALSARPELHVEGRDDQHSLVALLKRHGIAYADPFERSPPDLPEFKPAGSLEKLLKGMVTTIKASTGRAVGFLLDADAPLIDRWRAVRHWLEATGVIGLPETPPAEGFIGISSRFTTRVGVWLMPDNQRDGKLEDFLRDLIDEHDRLIGHAESSTDAAKDLGSLFSDPDRIKAIIHTWLAWQVEPGKRFGIAMNAGWFRHDTETAQRFVRWFKTLYAIA